MKLKIFFIILVLTIASGLVAQNQLESSHSVSNINDQNVTLSYTSAISGHVYESDGVTPIYNTVVRIYDLDWNQVGYIDYTDQNGYYIVKNLGPGNYFAYASGDVQGKGYAYFEEYYLNASTKGEATQIAVTDSDTTVNINFTLDRKAAISGRVCESDGTTPIANTMVNIYNSAWESVTSACTDANGYYTAYGLLSGDYYVESTGYIVGEGEFYLPEYYDDSSTKAGATLISVSPPNTAGNINFDMTTGMHIRVYSDPTWAGVVSVSPQKLIYAPGESVELKATVSETYPQYRFDHWGGDHSGTDNPTTVVLDSDKDVTAYFVEIVSDSVTLTMKKKPAEGGTIDPPPGTYTYNKGDTVAISAVSAEGYHFKKWKCSVEDPYDPTTVVYMNQNETVTAYFESDSVTLVMKVYPANSGETNPSPGTYVYERGDTVNIEAIPAEGYRFLKWKCNVKDPYDPTTELYMKHNETVTAKFELINYELTISVDPAQGGTTVPEPGKYTNLKDEVVQVTAYPEEGYEFVGWTGDVTHPKHQTVNIKMNDHKAIRANFMKSEYTLIIKADPAGGGTTDPEPGEYTFSAGDTVELVAIPYEGYQFTKWTGQVERDDSTYTTVLIARNKTVTACFEGHDNTPPELTNCYPCPHAKAVPRNTKIKFKLYDKNSGPDPGTLNVWIDDVYIIHDGIIQNEEDVKIISNSHICKVMYNSQELFENCSTVSVSVQCSDHAEPANMIDTTYSFEIGTASINKTVKDSVDQNGGSVIDTTSHIQIHVPPNAVDDTTEITINHIENPPELPEEVSGIATPYHFGPDGFEFNIPVVVQIPYTRAMLDSSGINNPLNLQLYYFHSLTGEWEKLDIDSTDTEHKILFLTVKEFCYFNVVKEKEQTTVDNDMNDFYNKPDYYCMLENYPNPFNPETHIRISIPENTHVVLGVYNMKGKLIKILIDEHKQKGNYNVMWHGRDKNNQQVSTGMYVFRMKIGNQIIIRKATLLK